MFTLFMILAAMAAILAVGWAARLIVGRPHYDPDMCAANSWNTAEQGIHENSVQLKADAAIARYLLVKLGSDSAHCAVAGVADAIIGYTDDEGEAAEDTLTIMLLTGGRTALLTADGAITAGDDIFVGASGKVTKTAGTQYLGVAKTGASADGVVFECLVGRPSSQNRTISFPINLASITTTQDVVTAYIMPTGGIIRNTRFVVNVPVTTGSKLASLNLEIGSTDLTGGVIALTSALATPMGKVIEDTTITALNVFAAGDNISVEASAVTAFSEGSGTYFIEYTEFA